MLIGNFGGYGLLVREWRIDGSGPGTDRIWELREPHRLGKPLAPCRTGGDCRLFTEAILWIARTDSPWRDLSEEFGRWNTVFKRIREWVKCEVFCRMFNALSDDPVMEYAMIGATIVKVHRHGQDKKGAQSQAIGKSTGGWTTQILEVTDALGKLIRVRLLPVNQQDTISADPLTHDIEFGGLLADKAFDCNGIVDEPNDAVP
ncbi:IS5 family transposase [Nitratireductor rhodophyticola]|uniref:IS5 family transposase n=1 Tax=Nitratireductor rhodophyticola TaxID=2854036 RepID=UPI00300888CD